MVFFVTTEVQFFASPHVIFFFFLVARGLLIAHLPWGMRSFLFSGRSQGETRVLLCSTVAKKKKKNERCTSHTCRTRRCTCRRADPRCKSIGYP